MRIRTIKPADKSAVRELHTQSGFQFPWPDADSKLVEAARMVIGSDGSPIAACIAKRSPEILLAMRRNESPREKLAALSLIHEAMRGDLVACGYREANCFLPPELERGYGRHLTRLFGWKRAWAAYTIFDPETHPVLLHSTTERLEI